MGDTRSVVERAGLVGASDYQVKIFEAVHTAVSQIIEGETPNSLIVSATAGSGKTTTAVASTNLIPQGIPTIFLAFNKKIADELAMRLPPGIPAKTFHSHWLKQWGRYVWNRHKVSVQINQFKVRNAVDRHFGFTRFNRRQKKNTTSGPGETLRQRKLREQADDVAFLVDKAKLFGVVPHNYAGAQSVAGYEDNDYFWFHVLEYFDYEIDLEVLPETIEIARKILTEGLENESEIDFSDMLFLPAVKRISSETYSIVVIDESQDTNGLQRHLLSCMISPGGMIMAIGDRRQSIYAFRNADAGSMDRIKEDFHCDELPLSISYRCGRRIVAEAAQIYDEIEAAPNAAEGSVERPGAWKLNDFQPGYLVICRNNAPTIALAYRLVRERIRAKVLGRDIGEGLMKLIQKLDVDDTLVELIDQLRGWRDHQIALIERKEPGDERSKEQIRDKYACISNLATSEEIVTVKDLLNVIDQLFTSRDDEKQTISPNRVTLSTIHKCKGAEADTVIILDPHLINPWWITGDWQTIQETNLLFVAVTRAKNRLVFVNSEDIVA